MVRAVLCTTLVVDYSSQWASLNHVMGKRNLIPGSCHLVMATKCQVPSNSFSVVIEGGHMISHTISIT